MGASAGTTPSIDDDDTSLATTEFVQDETVAAGDVTGTIGTGLTIGAGVVEASMVAADVATQAELNAVSALYDTEAEIEAITGALFGTSKAVTSGYIWVADGVDFESVVMSGDATIATGGAVTIADDSHNHVIGNIDGVTSLHMTQVPSLTPYMVLARH